MQTAWEDELENLVDDHGLYGVATALAKICRNKAEHLYVNWQDRSAASRWDKASTVFDKAWAALRKIQLP